MNISNEIQKLKKLPNFAEKVGMILVHNGVVRATSRNGKKVLKLIVKVDYDKINSFIEEFSREKGIFKIIVKANQGEFFPLDDLLFIIVAGDIRDNVKDTLSTLLEKIKLECIKKEEILEN